MKHNFQPVMCLNFVFPGMKPRKTKKPTNQRMRERESESSANQP